MGHHIRAAVGREEAVAALAADLRSAAVIGLPQGFAMVLVTDALWDQADECFPGPEEPDCPVLVAWTGSVRRWLEAGSRGGPLAYIETDYAGGYGTQAGVLVEGGTLRSGPAEGPGTINRLLAALGVCCLPGQDEFDALELGRYRRMDGPVF